MPIAPRRKRERAEPLIDGEFAVVGKGLDADNFLIAVKDDAFEVGGPMGGSAGLEINAVGDPRDQIAPLG